MLNRDKTHYRIVEQLVAQLVEEGHESSVINALNVVARLNQDQITKSQFNKKKLKRRDITSYELIGVEINFEFQLVTELMDNAYLIKSIQAIVDKKIISEKEAIDFKARLLLYQIDRLSLLKSTADFYVFDRNALDLFLDVIASLDQLDRRTNMLFYRYERTFKQLAYQLLDEKEASQIITRLQEAKQKAQPACDEPLIVHRCYPKKPEATGWQVILHCFSQITVCFYWLVKGVASLCRSTTLSVEAKKNDSLIDEYQPQSPTNQEREEKGMMRYNKLGLFEDGQAAPDMRKRVMGSDDAFLGLSRGQ